MADTTTSDGATPAEEPTTTTEQTDPPEQADPPASDVAQRAAAAARAERDAARAEARTTAQKLTAVLQALGIEAGTEQADPERLAADLATTRAENAVLRHGQRIADTDALLDSRAFVATLGDLDAGDPEAVRAHITAFVEAHPRYALQPDTGPVPGARDAAAGRQAAPAQGGDWLRNAITRR